MMGMSDDCRSEGAAMSEKPRPLTGTDAWFKEVENRLEDVRAQLEDAEIQVARSMRAHGGIPPELSLVQERFANIEHRLAKLLSATRADRTIEPSQEAVLYRDVPGFPGYRAGSDGTIWGSRSAGRGYGGTREWRALKPYLVRPGPAPTVSLYRDRVRHSMRVAAVVLLAFVGERPDGFEVRSKNGDHLDNRLDNLCYVPAGAVSEH
jgi:hypothetical protein